MLTAVPVVTISPMNQTVVSPDTATFNCSATANSQAEIQWLRNGMVLSSNKLTMIIQIVQGDCNITRSPSECVVISILEVTHAIPANTGEYMCSASNAAGSDMETASLTIHGIYSINHTKSCT